MDEELDGKSLKIFEIDGYNVAIHRIPTLGHLCGYVQLKQQWKKNYFYTNDIIDCHGGITFEGELLDFKGTWIGFDCGHATDIVPASLDRVGERIGRESFLSTYKDEAFVTAELESIVEQLKKKEY
ncbi:MAG: hypothetical protein FWF42_00035 [Streptococcaceae bacterium]|nr:hypothetical protein [Streptococcaceae bacterium]MCL2858062.1 hypothetical protein [Streptococcaceae bacterium]